MCKQQFTVFDCFFMAEMQHCNKKLYTYSIVNNIRTRNGTTKQTKNGTLSNDSTVNHNNVALISCPYYLISSSCMF